MTVNITDRAPQTVILGDRRELAYYDFGDPAGRPCVYLTGSPISGVVGAMWDEMAREAGVRWISVDKPGYGHSSVDPQLSLARAAADLSQLLDHLGAGRAAFVGESGGAPYALSIAHDLPDRVSGAFLIAGMGPASEAWARKEMKPQNRQVMWMSKNAPFLLRRVMSRIAAMDKAKYTAWVLKGAPEPDVAVMRRHPELLDYLYYGGKDAFRQGTGAAVQEMTMFARPWHFAVEDVHVPVQLWHGADDRNVPIGIAKEVIRRLPDCRAHIIEGKGHMLAIEHRDDVLAAILESAS